MMTKQIELKKQAYESNLKSRALSVLIYLIDRSNKDLTCFPAIPTMAEQLHISVSTVKRALHELVQEGVIKKDARFRDKNRGQTSNLYTLVLLEEQPEQMEDERKPDPISVEHINFENLKAEWAQREKGIDFTDYEKKMLVTVLWNKQKPIIFWVIFPSISSNLLYITGWGRGSICSPLEQINLTV